MKPPKIITILVGMLILFDRVLGQQQNIFMAKYKDAIQEHIMTGHEKGWPHCDILSSNPSNEGVPHISMTLDKIQTLNIKSAFEKTHCLLVHYDISSKDNLSTLLEFGWNAITHIRMALVIKMGLGITLEMATNISTLPFLVAAESEHGKIQFLCPVVGDLKPRLWDEMCSPSFLEHKDKVLRIGLLGLPPDFVMTSVGTIDGVNIRFINTMAERLQFIPEIKVAESFNSAEEQVSKHIN